MLLKGAIDSVRVHRANHSSWSRWDSVGRVRPYFVARALGGWHRLGPFIGEIWKFHTARGEKAVLHYDAELERKVLPELVLLRCKNELRTLEKTFGFRLDRVNVLLFQCPQLIAEIFGPEYGGLGTVPPNDTVTV